MESSQLITMIVNAHVLTHVAIALLQVPSLVVAAEKQTAEMVNSLQIMITVYALAHLQPARMVIDLLLSHVAVAIMQIVEMESLLMNTITAYARHV